MQSESKGLWLCSVKESEQLLEKYKHSKFPQTSVLYKQWQSQSLFFPYSSKTGELESTHLKHNKIRETMILLNCAMQVSLNNFSLLYQARMSNTSSLGTGYSYFACFFSENRRFAHAYLERPRPSVN